MGLFNDPKFTAAVDAVRWRAVQMDQARAANDFDGWKGAAKDYSTARDHLADMITDGLDIKAPVELELVQHEPVDDVADMQAPVEHTEIELAPAGVTPAKVEDIETGPHDTVEPVQEEKTGTATSINDITGHDASLDIKPVS